MAPPPPATPTPAGGIAPPDTGSGGYADSENGAPIALLIVAGFGLLAATGGATLAFARRR